MSTFIETAEEAAYDGDYVKAIAFTLLAIRDELYAIANPADD